MIGNDAARLAASYEHSTLLFKLLQREFRLLISVKKNRKTKNNDYVTLSYKLYQKKKRENKVYIYIRRGLEE